MMHRMRPRFASFELSRSEASQEGKSGLQASNAISLSTEVQAHLASLLGCDEDMSILLTAFSSEGASPKGFSSAAALPPHLPACRSLLPSSGQDFEYEDACSESSLSIKSECHSPLSQFGLSPETFDRVGGWENLCLSVEEARSRINLNKDLSRALTSPVATDLEHSYEMLTALISSLLAIVLQSSTSRSEGEVYFHLHFNKLWGLSAALVTDLANCIVDSLSERNICWPGDDIAQANPRYNQRVAVNKIRMAFASLANHKPALPRVDEDAECDLSLDSRLDLTCIRPSSQSFAPSHQHSGGSSSPKSMPLPKMGRSSMDSKRDSRFAPCASVADIFAAYTGLG